MESYPAMYVATATAALVTIARLRQKLGATKKARRRRRRIGKQRGSVGQHSYILNLVKLSHKACFSPSSPRFFLSFSFSFVISGRLYFDQWIDEGEKEEGEKSMKKENGRDCDKRRRTRFTARKKRDQLLLYKPHIRREKSSGELKQKKPSPAHIHQLLANKYPILFHIYVFPWLSTKECGAAFYSILKQICSFPHKLYEPASMFEQKSRINGHLLDKWRKLHSS